MFRLSRWFRWPASAASALALALAVMLTAAPTRAAPLDPRGEDWEGLSELLGMAEVEIGRDRVVVTDKLDFADLKPADALLVVHPERPIAPEELSAFMHAGGRLLLLDDYGAGQAILTHFGIRRVPLPAHPTKMLRGNPAFAIAEPASSHAAVRDVELVVTNHATGLADTGLAPLLVVHGEDEPDVLLAVAGVVGSGRFLAVGDASVAMNAMLRFPGNHALARAILLYAMNSDTGGGASDRASAAKGAENGKLYVLTNGTLVTGRFISGAGGPTDDASRAFFETVETLRRGVPPLAAYLVALLVGLGVVVWTSRRAGRTHKASNPRFVRAIPIRDQGGVAGHAALLVAPGAPLASAAAELRSALEEEVAARLGLDRPAPHEELVVKARAAGLVAPAEAPILARLLDDLSRFEPVAGKKRRDLFGLAGRAREGRLIALAARVHDLLATMDSTRHGKLGKPT